MVANRKLFQVLAGPLARLWLNVRRIGAAPAAGSLRILNFHETPRELHAVFRQLAGRLLEAHGLATPREAEAVLESGRAARGAGGRVPCLLSFDDGFRSNYVLAREVLEPLGIRALFFVCPGLADLEPREQRRRIAANIRLDPETENDARLEHELMTWEEIQALASAGHEIGSHGWSHRRFSTLSRAELEEEIGRAASSLETRLGRPSRWLAYPFGNAASVKAEALACVATRHRFCRSGVRGLNAPGAPALGLLSQTIDLRAPLDYQLAVSAGALDFRYRAARRRLSAELAAAR